MNNLLLVSLQFIKSIYRSVFSVFHQWQIDFRMKFSLHMFDVARIFSFLNWNSCNTNNSISQHQKCIHCVKWKHWRLFQCHTDGSRLLMLHCENISTQFSLLLLLFWNEPTQYFIKSFTYAHMTLCRKTHRIVFQMRMAKSQLCFSNCNLYLRKNTTMFSNYEEMIKITLFLIQCLKVTSDFYVLFEISGWNTKFMARKEIGLHWFQIR